MSNRTDKTSSGFTEILAKFYASRVGTLVALLSSHSCLRLLMGKLCQSTNHCNGEERRSRNSTRFTRCVRSRENDGSKDHHESSQICCEPRHFTSGNPILDGQIRNNLLDPVRPLITIVSQEARQPLHKAGGKNSEQYISYDGRQVAGRGVSVQAQSINANRVEFTPRKQSESNNSSEPACENQIKKGACWTSRVKRTSASIRGTI